MDKKQFMEELRQRLAGLPQSDREERLLFYGEMIDDRMEDGRTEAEAVASVGTPEEVARQILEETSLSILMKEKVRNSRRPGVWEMVLLVLGAPLWLPLLLAALAVVFSLYAAVWSIVVSLWAADLSLAAGALGGLAGAVWYLFQGQLPSALMMLAGGVVCAGLAILLFFGCLELSRALIRITKKGLGALKALFMGKEKEEG